MAREIPKRETDGNETQPSHDAIAQRAYQIFIERGRPDGRDLEHWLEAEAQLSGAIRTSSKAPRATARRQVNGQR